MKSSRQSLLIYIQFLYVNLAFSKIGKDIFYLNYSNRLIIEKWTN